MKKEIKSYAISNIIIAITVIVYCIIKSYNETIVLYCAPVLIVMMSIKLLWWIRKME